MTPGTPMIELDGLVKRYGGRTAVQDVSFKVARGEILGLLGPNGAGKSTIMRILACYLPATAGGVRVAGFDVFTQSAEVRRRIGYMPEHNPLPPDMRVREYLKFRARLKGLGVVRSRARVDVVLEQCGLTEVTRRIIGALSKGYRQRVGLADALVHEPDLVILDEPTIGLDPGQIRAVRQLIKDLGPAHTVLLSSHILPEVEMTCQRVLILHEGRLLTDDDTEHLQRSLSDSGVVIAEIAAPVDALRACWLGCEGIEHFDLAPIDGRFVRCALTPVKGVDLRPEVFARAAAAGWTLRELTRSRHSLEDVFLHVTRGDREEDLL